MKENFCATFSGSGCLSRELIINMKLITLGFLIFCGASLSTLMAQSDVPVELRISVEPCSLTQSEISQLKVDTTAGGAEMKGVMLSGDMTNTGTVPFNQLSIRVYVIVSPSHSGKDDSGGSYTVANVFTFKNMDLPNGETAKLRLGKVIPKSYAFPGAFGAEEQLGQYEGFVAKFYQNGTCIGTKSSKDPALYAQAMAQYKQDTVE